MTLQADDHPPAEGRPEVCRRYGIPFREVWDALLKVIGSLRRWQVREADPRAGTIRASTSSPLGYRPLEAMFTLSLDELGQTRLEIRFEPAKNVLLKSAATSRSRRVIRRLERSMGASGRS